MKVFHKIPVFFEGWLPLCTQIYPASILESLKVILRNSLSGDLSTETRFMIFCKRKNDKEAHAVIALVLLVLRGRYLCQSLLRERQLCQSLLIGRYLCQSQLKERHICQSILRERQFSQSLLKEGHLLRR